MPACCERVVFGDFDVYGATLSLAIVGGDFYDFIELEKRFGLKGRLGIIIADASGHGLSAAMLIRDLNTAIYTGISFQSHYEGETTPLLFKKINKRMFNSSQPNSFISCFYGELHQDGLLKYINAGHPAPILVKATNEAVALSQGGPVLGAVYDFGADYKVGGVTMSPGDVLAVFTDGVLEARNRKGEEFGATRLVESLIRHRHKSSLEIFRAIVARVKRFRSEVVDDLTLIIIKR
jgi:serine phosphatase RsbU (regulator of sigma subunit)